MGVLSIPAESGDALVLSIALVTCMEGTSVVSTRKLELLEVVDLSASILILRVMLLCPALTDFASAKRSKLVLIGMILQHTSIKYLQLERPRQQLRSTVRSGEVTWLRSTPRLKMKQSPL
jgi:hypothetical protein